jgi:hypothetical protein
MLRRHGSPLIRNAGTLAGNIANGSPIGDAMPALFVLGAEIELAGRGGATRRVEMNEFYTGYKTNVMRPDELIARVHIPLPSPNEIFKLYKVSQAPRPRHLQLHGRVLRDAPRQRDRAHPHRLRRRRTGYPAPAEDGGVPHR